MPVLFKSSSSALTVHGASPALLSGIAISGLNDGDSSIGLLITGIALSQGVRIAYFTTLAESVYIYPLGNKVGKCMITGLALPSCNGTNGYSNIDKLMEFYRQKKASNFANIETPITVTVGETTISGYLEDMQFNLTSQAEHFGSATFNLVLSVIPDL